MAQGVYVANRGYVYRYKEYYRFLKPTKR